MPEDRGQMSALSGRYCKRDERDNKSGSNVIMNVRLAIDDQAGAVSQAVNVELRHAKIVGIAPEEGRVPQPID